MTGSRQDKKTATRLRITEAGLRLFLDAGYSATTVDDIAEAAGISRRSFFHYFRSKDDILLAWHGAGAVSAAVGAAMLQQSPAQTPLSAAFACLAGLVSRYETDESKAMDALMQSSEALRLRKDAAEIKMERDLADAMTTLWPDPSRSLEIRFAAVVATGTLRLSIDDWRRDDEGRRLGDHLERNRRLLSAQTGEATS